MSLRALAAAISLLASLLTGATASAQERDRAFSSGLSLGIAAGVEGAGIGGQALYYMQLSERWRLASHVAVGYLGAAGFAGGVMAAFGRRHRLVLDFMVGPVAAYGSTGTKTKLDYGVCALAGWEWMSPAGVSVRSSIGPSYLPEYLGSDRFYVAFNLISLDYKLW
ncbi:MAG: hypothetical protein JWN48_2129 [Myxococcaceae bacterium]|nr:hypothetical protein [Myxococcaceae bacterium]